MESSKVLQARRVYIISGHALFADAITRLVQDAHVEVVGRAGSLEDALPALRNLAVEAIIVDHDDPALRDAEVVSQLVGHDEARQVIFLTLSGNQMIVHRRERVEGATPADLLRAIRSERPRP
jgi:DNA-binding NarL/FixJ family response regulator